MTKKVLSRKGHIIITSFLAFIFVLYTILVKFVDVKPIGPNDSSVGFASLNNAFRNLVGSNMTLYKISEVFGYLLLLIVAYYGIIGAIQLFKTKDIKKVDREILLLGCFYVLVLIAYVFFEKVVINYRPIIIEGELEASYPSSHTMLSLCVGLSSLLVSKRYMNIKYLKIFNISTIVLMSLVLLLRTISGVHWISDIIGGILISLTLVMCFKTAYSWKRRVNIL